MSFGPNVDKKEWGTFLTSFSRKQIGKKVVLENASQVLIDSLPFYNALYLDDSMGDCIQIFFGKRKEENRYSIYNPISVSNDNDTIRIIDKEGMIYYLTLVSY